MWRFSSDHRNRRNPAMEHLPRTITGTSPSLKHALWIVPLVLACALQAVAREEKGSSFETRGATIYYEIIGPGSGTPFIFVNVGPRFDHAYLHASSASDPFANNRLRFCFYPRGI